MCFRAKAEKKDLKVLLTELGLKDLLTRLEEDSKEAQDKAKEKQPDKDEDEEKTAPERRSARQTQKKIDEKKRLMDLDEIPTENIEWDKVTAEEKQQWKEVYHDKQQQLFEEAEELMHSYSVAPIGRDRTYRRYWIFQSIPGLFVENFEEFLPEGFLEPTGQVEKAFHSEHLPLEGTNLNQSSEGKSTSSDKENEDITFKDSNSDSKNTMGVDNKLELQNVFDQIGQFNGTRWSFFHRPEQLDVLIAALNPRGHREGPLRAALQERKEMILGKLGSCPLSLLQSDSNQTGKKADKFQRVKSRNRQGVVKGDSAEELLELNLREMLLDLEDRVYIGSLGALKVSFIFTFYMILYLVIATVF